MSEDPTTFVTTWTRGSDGTFNDLKKEKFATLLAGGKTIKEAADQAGMAYATGLQWAKEPAMKLRKRDLRATPAVSQTFSVSIAMVCADLYLNATEARKDGKYSDSNNALVSLYKIAKAEKSLLETFDAKAAKAGSGNIVSALQAHLSKAKQVAEDSDAVDADGESV